MKFKVGDIVKVREGLKVDMYYNNYEFTDEMSKFCGKLVTIVSVYDDYYDIEEDNDEFGWTDAMLEPLDKEYGVEDK